MKILARKFDSIHLYFFYLAFNIFLYINNFHWWIFSNEFENEIINKNLFEASNYIEKNVNQISF